MGPRVVTLVLRALPADLAEVLRNLAADVESGAVTQLYCGYVKGDDYGFLTPSSPKEALVLADLMHEMALSKFRSA